MILKKEMVHLDTSEDEIGQLYIKSGSRVANRKRTKLQLDS